MKTERKIECIVNVQSEGIDSFFFQYQMNDNNIKSR